VGREREGEKISGFIWAPAYRITILKRICTEMCKIREVTISNERSPALPHATTRLKEHRA
jgi:hypothetical protein